MLINIIILFVSGFLERSFLKEFCKSKLLFFHVLNVHFDNSIKKKNYQQKYRIAVGDKISNLSLLNIIINLCRPKNINIKKNTWPFYFITPSQF